MKKPRGRYAPSPTGRITVGNAYTAIRSWLDVRSRGGTWIVRLDDTDPARTTVTAADIAADLGLLGLRWDEGWDVGGPVGPYVTSERTGLHKAAAERLLRAGAAYWDYNPPIDDVAAHKAGRRKGRQGAYRGSPERVEGIEPVLRLKVGVDRVAVYDRVFGEISVAGEDVGEVALLRSDGTPTYHLASCVDDVEMGVTTVVRGADWLNFLPQHVLIFEALGADLPEFAHVPLLVGPDGQKLSKRAGDLSVDHLVREEGLPAAALCAYLANLGFAERPDLLDLDEIAMSFDIRAHNRMSPRFDPKKLRSFSRRWLAERTSDDELAAEIEARAGVHDLDDTVVRVLLPGIRPRVGSFAEAARLVDFLGLDDKPARDPSVVTDDTVDTLLATDPWDPDALEAAIDAAFSKYAEDRKTRLAGLRDALAPGLRVTPPLHYVLAALGRDRAAIRLGSAV
jgi:glutamyl/glutaminyl-tRNA synthetase